MALDVFVGPLTRYYVGGWRRSVDKTSRRAPAAADAPRPGPDPRRDCARLHASVVAWRQTLDAALAPHLGEPLAWDESISAPWFTAQPGWRGFGSLVLWAAYAEQPGLRRPETLPTDWDDDPALERVPRKTSRRGFPSLQ